MLHSLSAAPCSLPEILDRTRDINDEVCPETSAPATALMSLALACVVSSIV